jgi:hypothetical protein
MGTVVAIPNKNRNDDTSDLFNKEFATHADALRLQEQRERLVAQAREMAELLDRLDGQLSVDRERAIAMLAESTGLLELVLEDVRSIRDIDESFGAGNRRQPRVARQALKFERGIAYLVGIFSVVGSGEELPVYNWSLIRRDIQDVLGIARRIVDLEQPAELAEAA